VVQNVRNYALVTVSSTMPTWGLAALMVFGVVLVFCGLPVAFNWRSQGNRAYELLLPVLPEWYRRRGLIAFRIWIGGGLIAFGVVVLVAATLGLTK